MKTFAPRGRGGTRAWQTNPMSCFILSIMYVEKNSQQQQFTARDKAVNNCFYTVFMDITSTQMPDAKLKRSYT